MIEKKDALESDFVGFLGIKNYKKVNEILIQPKIDNFFHTRKITNPKEINVKGVFSDKDFLNTREPFLNPYFYDFIVDKIHKTNGKVEIPMTYCITLDETNCPILCPETKIFYDEILLYDQPVFYFIYIDIKEVFACLRKQNN